MKTRKDTVRGICRANSRNGRTNELAFLAEIMLGRLNVALPVRVDSVIRAEEPDGPAGYVSATPLINQLDAWDNVLPQAVIPGCPISACKRARRRWRWPRGPETRAWPCSPSGTSAGFRKAGKKTDPVPPGAFRRFSQADGIYFGGFLGRTPATWIELDPEGRNITFHSPGNVTVKCGKAVIKADEGAAVITRKAVITAPAGITVNGDVHINGSIGWTGEATGDGMGGPARFQNGILNTGGLVRSNGVALEAHVHISVEPGSGTSGSPRQPPPVGEKAVPLLHRRFREAASPCLWSGRCGLDMRVFRFPGRNIILTAHAERGETVRSIYGLAERHGRTTLVRLRRPLLGADHPGFPAEGLAESHDALGLARPSPPSG